MNTTTEQKIIAATSAVARLTALHHWLGDPADAPGHILPAPVVHAWAKRGEPGSQHEALAGAIGRGWIRVTPDGYCLTRDGLAALQTYVPHFRRLARQDAEDRRPGHRTHPLLSGDATA
ncbi:MULTISPECIES: hypothetical protein [unclassified Thioalkalivibrio]|uniref:hypothetical protein n=1 Tax=unclassified Thioalkalivibrio TaxID=2621013 RepID=UPI00037F1B75|nr:MULTISPECIES: hypothetical protein [unclassified Thioalkalivibrio]